MRYNYERKKLHTLSHSIAEERLNFKEGITLGTLSIATEDGKTRRKVRRIVEKRVSTRYWRERKNFSAVVSNRDRATVRRRVSNVTENIYGQQLNGFSFLTI